jgi:hypothetical protein
MALGHAAQKGYLFYNKGKEIEGIQKVKLKTGQSGRKGQGRGMHIYKLRKGGGNVLQRF